MDTLNGYHLTRSAQYAADIGPRAMFCEWRALKDSRRFRYAADSPALRGDPLTPCCPNRIVLIWSPDLATTT